MTESRANMDLVFDRKMNGNASAFCRDVVTEGVTELYSYKRLQEEHTAREFRLVSPALVR
jgi:hypothetical protein